MAFIRSGTSNLTTLGDGAALHFDASTITDATSAQDATVGGFFTARLEQATLAASNTGVTTTTAATLYIDSAPAGGSNQTLTNSYALLVGAGNTSLAGDLYLGGHVDMLDSKNVKLGNSDDFQLYHDGSNSYITNATGALKIATEDTGIAVTIGHGTSEVTIGDNLTVAGNLTVTGVTTQVDTVTMNAANAVVFEGATADGNETTLTIVDPTADRTQYLINQTGYIPVLAATTTTAITSTPAELNILDGVTAIAAELNYLDITTLGTAAASKALTWAADSTWTAAGGTCANLGTVTTVDINGGTVDGAIIGGTSAAAGTFAAIVGTSLSVGDGNITNVADIALDSISADGTDINIAVDDNSATAFTIKQGSDAYLIIDTANSSESVSIGTGISATVITIGHSTSETTVADNLTVTGDLRVAGATTLTATLLPAADNTLDLGSASKRWANIYTGDLHLANDRGNWTLIEENDYITLRNNHTGRRFRIVMEDITDTGDFGPDNNGVV